MLLRQGFATSWGPRQPGPGYHLTTLMFRQTLPPLPGGGGENGHDPNKITRMSGSGYGTELEALFSSVFSSFCAHVFFLTLLPKEGKQSTWGRFVWRSIGLVVQGLKLRLAGSSCFQYYKHCLFQYYKHCLFQYYKHCDRMQFFSEGAYSEVSHVVDFGLLIFQII